MGFGAIFLGIMFLYDFPIPVGKDGVAYMAPDIFPDLVGWILLLKLIQKRISISPDGLGLNFWV